MIRQRVSVCAGGIVWRSASKVELPLSSMTAPHRIPLWHSIGQPQDPCLNRMEPSLSRIQAHQHLLKNRSKYDSSTSAAASILVYRRTDRQRDGQTNRQTDKPRDRQTDKNDNDKKE